MITRIRIIRIPKQQTLTFRIFVDPFGSVRSEVGTEKWNKRIYRPETTK